MLSRRRARVTTGKHRTCTESEKEVQRLGRHHVGKRLNRALLGRDFLESNKLEASTAKAEI